MEAARGLLGRKAPQRSQNDGSSLRAIRKKMKEREVRVCEQTLTSVRWKANPLIAHKLFMQHIGNQMARFSWLAETFFP